MNAIMGAVSLLYFTSDPLLYFLTLYRTSMYYHCVAICKSLLFPLFSRVVKRTAGLTSDRTSTHRCDD